jgi:hypothetical protein
VSDTPDQPTWLKLQSKAQNFAFFSCLAFLVAIVCALAGFVQGSVVFLSVAGVTFVLALWFYQTAQFLHIRALLEKAASETRPGPV